MERPVALRLACGAARLPPLIDNWAEGRSIKPWDLEAPLTAAQAHDESAQAARVAEKPDEWLTPASGAVGRRYNDVTVGRPRPALRRCSKTPVHSCDHEARGRARRRSGVSMDVEIVAESAGR